MKKNIFLTGAPSSGKTTVIRKVIAGLAHPVQGFYTEEERIAGKRVGFLMKTLDNRTGYLAHQDITSDFHIRRYGVSIENIETIAVPSITPVNRNIIILDEIVYPGGKEKGRYRTNRGYPGKQRYTAGCNTKKNCTAYGNSAIIIIHHG
jgi:nucleoside-triphosphatase THEP1